MAIFTGTGASETINDGFVSATVFRAPAGAEPSSAFDIISGGGGNDFIDGGGGGDLIDGGDGDDGMSVFAGDSVDGGDGNDFFSVTSGGAGTFVDGGSGIDRLAPDVAPVDITGMSITSIETLVLGAGTFSLTNTQLNGFTTIDRFLNTLVANLVITAGGRLATTTVIEFNNLTVTGSSGSDNLRFDTAGLIVTDLVVSAGAGNDGIQTGAGNDLLIGGDGNDALRGEAGNDMLSGGNGRDTMSGGNGNDTISFADGDAVDGGSGTDRLQPSGLLSTAATVSGGLGIDTLAASGGVTVGAAVLLTGIENLALDSSPLTLTAVQLGSFTDIIADGGAPLGRILLSGGGTANLEVSGLATLDVLGSSGGDALTFTGSTRIVANGAAGNDTLRGGNGNDELSGGSGIDMLFGNGGNDTLSIDTGDSADGGNGDDLFLVFANLTGSAMLVGGTGTDTFAAQGPVVIAPAVIIGGIEKLALDGSLLTLTATQLTSFDEAVAEGGAMIGRLALSAAGSAVLQVSQLATLDLLGSAGGDSILINTVGSVPTDFVAHGGAGDDFLTGDDGDDVLNGGDGGDSLNGRAGRNSLDGGAGNDVLFLNSGDQAQGGDGDDRLVILTNLLLAGALDGGVGVDTLAATGPRVIGNLVTVAGIETLELGFPTITLTTGQLGSFSTIVGGAFVTEGSLALSSGGIAKLDVVGLTNLSVAGSAGVDRLILDGCDLAIEANGGNDRIGAGSGADTLRGGEGRDRLDGGAGDDLLAGGRGRDTLTGGDGNDRFGFELSSDGEDTIVDFAAGDDVIQISAAGFGGGLIGGMALTAAQLVVHGASGATSAAGQLIYDTSRSLLLWDADGTGSGRADKVATFSGVGTLSTADFEIIA